MVSQEDVFKLIYYAATCFIPKNELTQEQIDRLNNITFRGCNCQLCRRNFKVHHYVNEMTIRAVYGHANPEKLRISWSKPFFNSCLKQKLPFTETLFLAVDTVLHEIIHILFLEYNEEQTCQKTHEWLKRNVWLEVYDKVPSKRELVKLGYSFRK